MKISKIFNNNVVLVDDADRGALVIVGIGIGFKKHVGQKIDQTKIMKTFVPDPGRDSEMIAALLSTISTELLFVTDEALDREREALNISKSSAAVVALADHLSLAIRSVQEGLSREYLMRAEVAHLYPDELRSAQRIVTFVSERMKVALPEDEAVAITMHLVNAGFARADLAYTYRMTAVFGQLFDILEHTAGHSIDRHGLAAARFITHLRYFFVRAESGKQLTDGTDELRAAIRTSFPDAHAAAVRLQTVLELRFGQPLTDEEVSFITIHAARMFTESQNQA